MVNDLYLSELEQVVKENKVVFIDFYADWCGPCRAMMPIVHQLSDELDSVKFYKVNVDNNNDFAEAFKVSSIPTFVVFKDGKQTEKIVGMRDKEDLVEVLK